ncbi:MAG: hypothetical protein A2131_00030 [Candidatus Sungbacteria bacterium GWC2_49_10]|uniref:Uncharacterized protein n=1 Tax=Candidatus Sungbacteria bacterium GWC2_49_10 TaxID=1802263 RepID=A0A1G2K6F8_9BACT|nr:MAG: hypothetical protein A2131_00030 [Candidatus Sungbacteria bacterium GWC2_49_10]
MFSSFREKSILAMEKMAVKKAVAAVIEDDTHQAVLGHPHVRKFEALLSARLHGASVLAMNSGTDALIGALKVLGIGAGDEVIVPAFSFISTASCVGWVGATPSFVDIRLDDYAMDVAKIEERITPKTKAIIVAHLYGQPTRGIVDILGIAQKHNLFVIEDAAQSFGAEIKINGEWRSVGTLGDVGCMSFSSTKMFAAPGNAGAFVIKDRALLEEVGRMRFYGAKVHYYDYPTIGINSKIHDIQAAALIAKLGFLDYWEKHHRKVADYYSKELAGVGDLILPRELPETKGTWCRYVVRTKRRDPLFGSLLKVVKERGPLWWPMKNYPVPLPYFSAFKGLGHKLGDFPIADLVSQEVISLPMTNYVTTDDAKMVAAAVKEFYGQGK